MPPFCARSMLGKGAPARLVTPCAPRRWSVWSRRRARPSGGTQLPGAAVEGEVEPFAAPGDRAPKREPRRNFERLEALEANATLLRALHDREGEDGEVAHAVRPAAVHLVVHRTSDGAEPLCEHRSGLAGDQVALRAEAVAADLGQPAGAGAEIALQHPHRRRLLVVKADIIVASGRMVHPHERGEIVPVDDPIILEHDILDRKSTRLNSTH